MSSFFLFGIQYLYVNSLNLCMISLYYTEMLEKSLGNFRRKHLWSLLIGPTNPTSIASSFSRNNQNTQTFISVHIWTLLSNVNIFQFCFTLVLQNAYEFVFYSSSFSSSSFAFDKVSTECEWVQRLLIYFSIENFMKIETINNWVADGSSLLVSCDLLKL